MKESKFRERDKRGVVRNYQFVQIVEGLINNLKRMSEKVQDVMAHTCLQLSPDDLVSFFLDEAERS